MYNVGKIEKSKYILAKTVMIESEQTPVETPREYRRNSLYSTVKQPPTPTEESSLPFASIIVLNFNGAQILPACLSHLANLDYPHFEIIVVDNASTDTSVAVITDLQSTLTDLPAVERVVVVRAAKNLGVAGGRNAGLAQSTGEIVAFIDNDGYADSCWLRHGVQHLIGDDGIGAIAASVFFNDRPLILNGAGGLIRKDGRAVDAYFNTPFAEQLVSKKTAFPMGCGMILKRSVATAIFPLETLLLKWFDDVEIGIRLMALGKSVELVPAAIVDHDYRTSDLLLSKAAWKTALRFEQARIRTYCKYFPRTQVWRNLLAEVCSIPKMLSSKNWRHAPVLTLALLWNLYHGASLFRIRHRWALSKNAFATLLSISEVR